MMSPEKINVEGTSSESAVQAERDDCDAHSRDIGKEAGGPVMRAGTEKDLRRAQKSGDSGTSGGSDGESIGSRDEAQNDANARKPGSEPQREGTWKDWRNAEIDGPGQGVPKSDQSPEDQIDKGGSKPETMRDGTLREP